MNTLMGDLTSFNDIQYPRYRFAFKLRKLQTSFLLQHMQLSTLQDIFHGAGIQPLRANHELTVPQLSSVLAEIYAHLKLNCKNVASPVQMQDAHTTCFNWLMLAFQCNTDNKATVGVLKIVLTLLCGSKVADKSKYFFSILANEGCVDRDGMQYFCYTIQLISNCLQEVIYPNEDAIDLAMSEALYCVRDEEDIEDEEEDGGLHRPFLSRFELVKVFTASPPANFLSWLDLWNTLPSVEKVAHQVKCSLCNKKTIVGFRYECTVCSNYHMCQMCFLKGRVSHPHTHEHEVLECMDYTKSLKKRLGFGQQASSSKSRIMTEPKEAPTLRLGLEFVNTNSISPIPRSSVDSTNSLRKISSDGSYVTSTNGYHLDSPVHNVQKRLSNSFTAIDGPIGRPGSGYVINTESPRGSTANIYSPSHTPEPIHKPTILRIGDSSTDLNGSHRPSRYSVASDSSSESGDGMVPTYDHAQSPVCQWGPERKPVIQSISSRRNTTGKPVGHRSLQKLQHDMNRRSSLSTDRFVRKSSSVVFSQRSSCQSELSESQQAEFNLINKKLSIEVDQLLNDIDPEGALEQDSPASLKLTEQEAKQEKKRQVNDELEMLQDQIRLLHNGFMGISEGKNIKQIPLQMPYIHQNLVSTTYHERSSSLDSTLKSY